MFDLAQTGAIGNGQSNKMDLFERIFERLPDAVIVVSEDGQISAVNQRITPMFGYAPAELIGQHIEVLVPASVAGTHASHRARFMSDPHTRRMGASQMQLRARRKDDSEFPADIMLSPLFTDAGTLTLCVVRDISERNALEEQLLRRTSELETLHVQLKELASRDGLTGLFNRRTFLEQLEWLLRNTCRRRESLSMLMIDLDFFKRVNDHFGHGEGDRVLRAVAATLTATCRQNDIAARYGGEEFAIALPDTDETGSRVVGENFRRAIEAITGLKVPVTASIGIATLTPFDGLAAGAKLCDELIAHADRALYVAKHEGRNCVRHAGALSGLPAANQSQER